MSILDRLTIGMGFGLFYGLKFEWLNARLNNMTVGIHAQEWEAHQETDGEEVKMNEIYIGILFIRFVLEFITPV